MQVFITGVGGFVGRHLARRLRDAGHGVAGSWIDEDPALDGVRSFRADVTDRRALAEALERAEPEAIVHLAALSHVGASWKRMPAYYQVNFLGTENLLEAAGGVPVVYASSAEVYGLVPEAEQPIREDREPAPRTPYALTKAAGERLALARGAIVVRSFNAIGAGQSPHFALPSFAAQLAAVARGEREPVLRVGNLSARRDFLHVADVAEAYRVLLERGEPGGVYNLAGGEVLSIAEALGQLIEVSGQSVAVEEEPARLRPVDMPLLRGCSSRLEALGWSPSRHPREALEELWRVS